MYDNSLSIASNPKGKFPTSSQERRFYDLVYLRVGLGRGGEVDYENNLEEQRFN